MEEKNKNLNRRTFLKVSAATAAAMSLPASLDAAGKRKQQRLERKAAQAAAAGSVSAPKYIPPYNAGDSVSITREYFDSLLLEPRYMDSGIPSTEFELFGHHFNSPIMTAALSHLGNTAPDGMMIYAKAAAACNIPHWVGMGEDSELEELVTTGAKCIKIIKPYYDNADVFHKIEHAVKCGCIAVGVDIDHSFNGAGDYDTVLGLKMKAKSSEEIAAFAKAAGVPFIVKGVLSVHDAVCCLKAGVSGIVISHHNGMMRYSVPPLMMIEDIIKAVGHKMKIFVDCGVASGYDAYKCLALGADAVSVGTHLMPLLKDGPDAVANRINQMTSELAGIMSRTGVLSLDKMDPTVIHKYVK